MTDRKLIKSVRITQRDPFKYAGSEMKGIKFTKEGNSKADPNDTDTQLAISEAIRGYRIANESGKYGEVTADYAFSSDFIQAGCRMDIYEEGKYKKAILIPPYSFNLKKSSRGDELLVYKGSSAESDTDVIKAALSFLSNDNDYFQFQNNSTTKLNYRIIQDPFRPKPPKIRDSFGDGFYYLNNGCQININWTSYKGTSVYSSKDDTANGDVSYKIVKVFTPEDGLKATYGRDTYYRMSSSGKKAANGKLYRVVYSPDLENPEDEIRYSGSYPDYTIIENLITEIKGIARDYLDVPEMKQLVDGLKLNFPDTESNGKWDGTKWVYDVPFVDFLNPKKNIPETPQVTGSQSGASASNNFAGATGSQKLQIKIDGGGGYKVKNQEKPNDLEVKALSSFGINILVGERPVDEGESLDLLEQNNDTDDYDPLEELDEEFSEEAFSDESIINNDLTIFSEQGDADGNIDVMMLTGSGSETGKVETTDNNANTTTTTKSTATDKALPGGGTGNRRWQEKMVIRGVTVKNGEVPDSYLAKLTGPGVKGAKLEKNAAKKMNQLAQAYFDKFGFSLSVQGPYRTFDVQNTIFDWERYEEKKQFCKVVKDKSGNKVKDAKCTSAARPGTSKHGWGQAMDLGPGYGKGGKQDNKAGFGPKDSPNDPLHEKVKEMFEWMDANAPKYGWINPAWAKRKGTAGYEPWHWEYVGTDLFAP